MNKLEAAYAEELETLKLAGEIIDYKFELVTLTLIEPQVARISRYTPDFMVHDRTGVIEFHETKGFLEEDSWLKLKIASEQWPIFRFVLVKKLAKKAGGGWERTEV